MTDAAVAHATFTIERAYPAAPAKVFAAFADARKRRRWFAEGDHFDLESHELNFAVGGVERVRGRFKAGLPLPAGTRCDNDITYHDIVENSRIVYAYAMSVGGARISVSLATFEFLDGKSGGTTLRFTEQSAFFANADGPQIRRQGWEALLARLAADLGAEG